MPSFSSILATVAALAPLGVFAAPTPVPQPAGWDVSISSEIKALVSNPDATGIIPNRYIVVYNTSYTDEEISATDLSISSAIAKRNLGKRALDGRQMSSFMSTMSFSAKGAATGPRMSAFDGDNAMLSTLAKDKTVAYIEADARVQAAALTTETGSTSGLARLSSAAAGAKDYIFDDTAGTGITAYVVDTGVFVDHNDFEGRATMGFNAINNVNTDENGHGSHVSATIAGKTFGVAKKANIIGVKVLDAQGGGSNSGVLEGLQFVAQDAAANKRSGKAVMNMSLGGTVSRAINAAVKSITDAGVVAVVAAGNENQDAANVSPASSPDAITVGAIDQKNDAKASFSNFGADVDIFAPGVNVQSIGITAKDATETLSGTSMASPHVAGLAAYLMSLESITSVAALKTRMLELATASGASVKKNTRGTTNLIANNGAKAAGAGAGAGAAPATGNGAGAGAGTGAAPATGNGAGAGNATTPATGAGGNTGTAIPAGLPAATDAFWQSTVGKALATLMGINV